MSFHTPIGSHLALDPGWEDWEEEQEEQEHAPDGGGAGARRGDVQEQKALEKALRETAEVVALETEPERGGQAATGSAVSLA